MLFPDWKQKKYYNIEEKKEYVSADLFYKNLELLDINASRYSEKVIELFANEFTSALSNWNIRKIVEPILLTIGTFCLKK